MKKKLTEKQKAQMQWLEKFGVTDKDELKQQEHAQEKPAVQKRKTSRQSFSAEITTDMEIDLHGFTITEAMAEVDSLLLAMKKSGHRTLRVIHGAGRHSTDTIGKKLHFNLRSIWKNRTDQFWQEKHNSGATIIFLK